jgi:SAM-dependent methyltransferase
MKAEWVERRCPLCGIEGEAKVFAEANIDLDRLDDFAFASRKNPEYMHPRLVECGHCGVLYGSPVLSPGTLAKAYEAAQFDSLDEGYHASRTYARIVRRTLSRLPDLDGSLDIGAGNGAFLEELQTLGFQNVQGVEPSTAPVACAKSHIRPLIRHGLFRPEDYEPGKLSLVTCFQTMEHVWDPMGTVRAAFSLLKPGGALVIVVHNRRSWSAKLLGRKSPIFDVEHLQLFCPATAWELLQRAGFGQMTVSSLWNRYPLQYWARLAPLPPSIKGALLRVLRASTAGRIPISVPAGNLVAIGFKPAQRAHQTSTISNKLPTVAKIAGAAPLSGDDA